MTLVEQITPLRQLAIADSDTSLLDLTLSNALAELADAVQVLSERAARRGTRQGLGTAWANQCGKLRWCAERRRTVAEFWLALANAVIVDGRLVRRAPSP